MAAVLALGGSPSGMRREARFSRTVSMHGRNENWIQHPAIARSRSAPELLEDVRIIPTVEAVSSSLCSHTPSPLPPSLPSSPALSIDSSSEDFEFFEISSVNTFTLYLPYSYTNINHRGRGEDTTEDKEAFCRICMVEFEEGAEDTLTLECGCKGELSLTHKECAFKGGGHYRTCEVCKQEIMNLPLIFPTYRVWRDAPILLIVSMLAYFLFLEIYLVKIMDNGAIAVSVPFGCILGLLGSMASTTKVRRRYAWIYATTQFVLVVVFAAVFYYSKLYVPGILSALLATFAGFGGAMCEAFILYLFLKWRDNQLRETRRRSLEGTRDSIGPLRV
ncbi:zinc finger, RING-CH-type, Zinc finger, RING/FYVE/PHD-type [Artemisia annua]|uniref:Zinc finger, RING-CH-type, Zinc finger, RING/FYVE/PHD-type n=1 Tax=Artemisia annua TaxID=35608 RepID=A0A2U1PDG9_ARTAN|nr:zinc finger, RING-CH-type, Zinc finger, RING/FYVE/PHD-type [Artemisia annua]